MKEKFQASLRESAVMRWTALLLLSLTMLFAYMFTDVLAPLDKYLSTDFGWLPDVYGTVSGSAYVLNTFGFLIVAGVILDRIGVRNSTMVSGALMLVGAVIKCYAVSGLFVEGQWLYDMLSSFAVDFPATAKLVCIGFALFGCGTEMAGITVTKGLVKWFQGKEMALAMGVQVAIARFGVFAVFNLSPWLYAEGGIPLAVAIPTLLLLIGFLMFLCYFMMDRKLEQQENITLAPEDEFKFSDLKTIFSSKVFMITAGLCVLFYASIFPFQKFAVGMLDSRLTNPLLEPHQLFSLFPIGAMILTPFLGAFLDYRGKGATMLIVGSLLMTICHTVFALVPDAYFNFWVALSAIIVLGVSFSLVPAALWPSVPKLMDEKVLGSAYAIIFWIQNIGLMGVPILIGYVLKATNAGVDINAGGKYDYTVSMLVFASFGVAAMLLGFWLKIEDKKKGYGLELPNRK